MITVHAYVRDVMTAPVVTVRPDTPYREIAAMFREHRVSGFPVTAADGSVIGVVSESDLLALADGRRHRGHRSEGEAAAGDLMTHPAVTISPDDTVQAAARVMHSHRLQRLPVIGRDGRLEGIVSRSDVLSVFRRSDEDIRREVVEDVIADGFFTDPARLTVTVHNGIVTLEGEPGSAVLGAGIAGQVEHLEGVIAVRDRFAYPARSAPSFPSDPGL
ncbi:MAG TPA: CBS domain-containing protein [Streptosporangiaceae bacterium]